MFGWQGHSGSRSADQAKGADSQEPLKLSSKQGSLTPVGDHCGRCGVTGLDPSLAGHPALGPRRDPVLKGESQNARRRRAPNLHRAGGEG